MQIVCSPQNLGEIEDDMTNIQIDAGCQFFKKNPVVEYLLYSTQRLFQPIHSMCRIWVTLPKDDLKVTHIGNVRIFLKTSINSQYIKC